MTSLPNRANCGPGTPGTGPGTALWEPRTGTVGTASVNRTNVQFTDLQRFREPTGTGASGQTGTVSPLKGEPVPVRTDQR